MLGERNTVDKYEFKHLLDQILNLINQGQYAEAASIADTIDWRRVKNIITLGQISDLYKINCRYEDARDIMLMAYERKPESRQVCYSLCELCCKTGEPVEAAEYYKEFEQLAPKDPGRYILKYKVYDAFGASIDEKIEVLEKLKEEEYQEKWMYELANLYHRRGLGTKCVEVCDELILWFGEGKYVNMAMELKMLHEPLSPSQQQKYDNRFHSAEQGNTGQAYARNQARGVQRYDQNAPLQERSRQGRMPQEYEGGRDYEDGSNYGEIQDYAEHPDYGTGQSYEADWAYGTDGNHEDNSAYGTDQSNATASGYEAGRSYATESAYGNDQVYRAEQNRESFSGSEYGQEYKNGSDLGDTRIYSSVASYESAENYALPENGYRKENGEERAYREQETSQGISIDSGFEEEADSAQIGEGDSAGDTRMYNVEEVRRQLKEQSGSSDEEMDIQVKTVDVSRYNTMNLQAEIAKGLQEILGSEETEPEVQETFDTKELQNVPSGEESEALDPRETVEETDSQAPYVDDINRQVMEEMRQDSMKALVEQAMTDQPPEPMAQVLTQESDGQIRLVVPERKNLEKQITGQMSIEDIRAEWERMKKESKEKNEEEVRQQVLRNTGRMFTEFEEKIRDSILKKMEEPGEFSYVITDQGSFDQERRTAEKFGAEQFENSAEKFGAEQFEKDGTEFEAEQQEATEEFIPGEKFDERGNQVESEEEFVWDQGEMPVSESSAEGAAEFAEELQTPLEEADDQGEKVDDDVVEEEAAETESFEEEVAEGEAAKAESCEEEAAEGEAAEGEAAKTESCEEEAAETESFEEEAAEGEAAKAESYEEEAAEGEAAETKSFEEEVAEGEAAETESYEEEAAEGEAAETESYEEEAAEGEAAKTESYEEEAAEEVVETESFEEEVAPNEDREGETSEEAKGEETRSEEEKPEETRTMVGGEEASEEANEDDRLEEEAAKTKGSENEPAGDVLSEERKDIIEEIVASVRKSEPPKITTLEEELNEEDDFAWGEDFIEQELLVEDREEGGEVSDDGSIDFESLPEDEFTVGGDEDIPETDGELEQFQALPNEDESVSAEEETDDKAKENVGDDAENRTRKKATGHSEDSGEASEGEKENLDEDSEESAEETAGEGGVTRALTKEEEEIYGSLVQGRGATEQLVRAIDAISMAPFTGNVVITGEAGMNTLELAKKMIYEVKMSDSNFSGKVAKIPGASLNKNDVTKLLDGLKNGALIIEKASALSERSAKDLYTNLQRESFGIIIVLLDTKKGMEGFFKKYENLKPLFNARMHMKPLSNEALAFYARQYARDNEFAIDDMGLLALHTRIDELQTANHAANYEDVMAIMDDAMYSASRKTIGHFFDILFGRRYDEEDMIYITEKDFR